MSAVPEPEDDVQSAAVLDLDGLVATRPTAHELLSPGTCRCDPCALTHGVFRELAVWRSFR